MIKGLLAQFSPLSHSKQVYFQNSITIPSTPNIKLETIYTISLLLLSWLTLAFQSHIFLVNNCQPHKDILLNLINIWLLAAWSLLISPNFWCWESRSSRAAYLFVHYVCLPYNIWTCLSGATWTPVYVCTHVYISAPYPVYDAGGVQVFDSAQHLVEQVGQPLVVQLHLNHLAEVSIHQLHHEIPAGEPQRGEQSRRDTHTHIH